jgi:RHS repeat-associated protein
VLGTTTTVFVGSHYEVTGGAAKKYYTAGGQTVAMRDNDTLYWLLTDHASASSAQALGSTSKVITAGGTLHSQQLYKPWGENRYALVTSLPTRYQYTGQYSYVSDFGLHFYNARWYDSQLGRFAQADSIVPGGV